MSDHYGRSGMEDEISKQADTNRALARWFEEQALVEKIRYIMPFLKELARAMPPSSRNTDTTPGKESNDNP